MTDASLFIEKAVRNDSGKLRIDLFPPEAIEACSKVLGFGAKKYEEHNWLKGMNYSRVYGSLLRHLFKWWTGEDFDKESGLHHVDHVLCNAVFLSTYVSRGMTEFDNRPITKININPELVNKQTVLYELQKEIDSIKEEIEQCSKFSGTNSVSYFRLSGRLHQVCKTKRNLQDTFNTEEE